MKFRKYFSVYIEALRETFIKNDPKKKKHFPYSTKTVNALSFRFDLVIFRNDFSVYITSIRNVSKKHLRKDTQTVMSCFRKRNIS